MQVDLLDPWIWPWFLGVFVVVGFAFEFYALLTGKTTLSRFIWDKACAWPPFMFFFGFGLGGFICGLGVHFFWHWCPEAGYGVGML